MAAEETTQRHGGQANRRRTTRHAPESRWAELPTDVLLSVAYAASYPTSSRYVTIGHVCTRWRAAIASAIPPGTFLCQLPVLALQPLPATLVRRVHITEPREKTCVQHIETRESMEYGIPRVVEPGVSGVVGSCHGWLVVLDPDAAHLAVHNPATGHGIHLPSLLPLITGSGDDVGVHRVILSHDPALRRDFVVFVAVDQENNLAVFDWQADDHRHHLAMTTRRLQPRMRNPSQTPVSSHGSVFLVELRGSLLVATEWCDRDRQRRVPEARGNQQILEVDFSADSGAVLLANQRLDLGGHAVFLGHGNSVAVDGGHFPALGTNVIFCPITTPTTVMGSLIDTEKFDARSRLLNGAILVSLYRRKPGTIPRHHRCGVLRGPQGDGGAGRSLLVVITPVLGTA